MVYWVNILFRYFLWGFEDCGTCVAMEQTGYIIIC